jgi:hypothetical protein
MVIINIIFKFENNDESKTNVSVKLSHRTYKNFLTKSKGNLIAKWEGLELLTFLT